MKKQTESCHDARDGMAVAEEVLVVAEHQQQIACPENHVELHEGDDARVMGHRACGYLVLARAQDGALPPVDEVASVLCGEDVERHHHHPHAEGGGQDEILGLGDHLAILNLGLSAPSRGVVLEEELHPSGPEEQAAYKPEEGLLGVALDEHSAYDCQQAHKTHEKRRVMQSLGCHVLLHYHHHSMAQWHGKEHKDE